MVYFESLVTQWSNTGHITKQLAAVFTKQFDVEYTTAIPTTDNNTLVFQIEIRVQTSYNYILLNIALFPKVTFYFDIYILLNIALLPKVAFYFDIYILLNIALLPKVAFHFDIYILINIALLPKVAFYFDIYILLNISLLPKVAFYFDIYKADYD